MRLRRRAGREARAPRTLGLAHVLGANAAGAAIILGMIGMVGTVGLVGLAGCGGGGGGGGAGGPGDLAGVVTDVEGRPVVGATVAVGGKSATSLTNGSFRLTGIGNGFQTVQAASTIAGHRWSGQTVVDLAGGEQNRSVNVMVSDEANQGGISGSVIDPSGFPLRTAKVFIAGPLGSTLAVTDDNGNYSAPKLEAGVTYTLTASLAGYVNDTRTVHVDPGTPFAQASFALAAGANQGAIQAPTNVSAQAWTVPDTVSRAPSARGVYDWLKGRYRAARGLSGRAAATAKVTLLGRAAGRSTPAGSAIEVDLFWTAPTGTNGQPYSDFFGYAIKRATSADALPNSQANAILRDPQATDFFDLDPALTPNTTYFYTVHSLETIGFPANGTIGPASNVASAAPLAPIGATTPAQGAVTSAAPTFQWTTATGAAGYQVYVWDQFPSLLGDNSHPDATGSAVPPIWPADLTNPGASFAAGGGATSLAYTGPALQSGHTYYWLVVAVDSTTPTSITALSASPLMKFTVQ